MKTKDIPAARPRTTVHKAPTVRTGGNGRMVIQNHEYLSDVTCTNAFTTTLYPLNPGLNSTFAWASNIANNYEFYQFRELSIEYRPFVGTSTTGSVMMSVDYDVADGAPQNKQRLMSFLGSTQGACYSPITYRCVPADLARFGGQRYTRPGSVPAGKDSKTYDVGNLIVATEGGAGAASGSLYLKYTLEMSTPHSPAEFPWDNSGIIYSPAASSSKVAPLTAAVVTNADAADPVIRTESTASFWLKAGDYLLEQEYVGTGITDLSTAGLAAILASAVVGFVKSGKAFAALGTGLGGNGATAISLPSSGVIALNIPAAWTTLTSMVLRATPFSYQLP